MNPPSATVRSKLSRAAREALDPSRAAESLEYGSMASEVGPKGGSGRRKNLDVVPLGLEPL